MQRRSFLSHARAVAASGALGLSGCVGAPQVEETEAGDPSPEGTEPAEGGETGSPSPTGTETEPPDPAETPTETPAEGGTATEAETPGATTNGGTEQVATHFRLGGRVEAWQGVEPESIADTENPTLQLEAGRTYRVTWENLDGIPHDFVVQDDQGEALAETAQTAEEGRSLSVSFTASEGMVQYICTIHPDTMVGAVRAGSG